MGAFRKAAVLLIFSAILCTIPTISFFTDQQGTIAFAGMGSGKDKMNWAKRRRDWCGKNPDHASCAYLVTIRAPRCWKTNVAHLAHACSTL